MNSEQIKHLEMIQGVVNRLSSDSFAYKAWAIGLVSALFALAASTSRPFFLPIAVLPTTAFWGLDAYYLLQERHFRSLYDAVRSMPYEEWARNPFSMDTRPHRKSMDTWLRVLASRTIAGLYLPLLLVVLAATVAAFTCTVLDALHAPGRACRGR